jgi:spore coat protein CotH
MVHCVTRSRSLILLSFGATLACSDNTGTSDDSAFATVTVTGTSTAGSAGTGGTDVGDATDAGDSGDSGDSGDDLPPDNGPPPDPNEQIPPFDEEGCHAIYAQDLLPTFELTIQPVAWEQLMYMWNNGADLKNDGENPKRYLPLQEFRYGDIVILDAEIRLRGNSTNWDHVPGGDKMQFQIGFHQNDKNGHFLGLKRLCFDAHTANRHLLRDRLSLAVMREVGIAAPCANNARLVINGEYYGIFTNVEKLDEVFVERVFDEPTGDLWKSHGWELKTNKDTANSDRLNALMDAKSTEEIYTYLKFEQALRVYAADAVLPNGDGKWAGGLNCYLYDHPLDGKFWLLPWDMDNTLDRFNDDLDGPYPTRADPVVWEKENSHGRLWYDAALDDDMWFEYYIEQIGEILYQAYTPEKMHGRIDEWTAQIEDAVLTDENKPWSNEEYYLEVEELHEVVDTRYHFLDDWLECWKDGGEKDDDGYCEPS